MKKLVYHHNLIGHEINESLEYYEDDVLDREVYCRKLHCITEPLEKDCWKCVYFAGLEQGHGHECAWEDVGKEDMLVEHRDRYKEYERVDRLIKTGVLDSYDNDTVARIKDLEYDKDKWLYEQSVDKKYRYIIGEKGERNLICFGINPSTASPEDLDPTMRRVKGFAQANGYDGYIMLNIYPHRSTNPDGIEERENSDVVRENLKTIEYVLSEYGTDIIAAWGNNIKKREYLSKCLELIVEIADRKNAQWYSLGDTTKEGHPRHPLYIKSAEKPKEFDIHKYCQKF